MPGYCGPNPYVNANGLGNINFSYGWTDLYQLVNVGAALPNSGTGLRINGYNFGFQAKNGNGWDDGRTDALFAYVQFNSPTGTQLFNHTHNLMYKFDWTYFSYSETFTTPYAAKDVGTVRYGFVGQDNNYWAGPYGPEIRDVSFSLKYSVDPCYVNVLSSPSCPGYLEAIASYSAVPSTGTVSEPTTTANTAATAPVVESAPSTAVANSTTAPLTSTPVAANTSTATTTAAVSTSPARAGEVTVAGSTGSRINSVSTTQVLSIVRNEQSRISQLETATVTAAVEQAKQESSRVVAEAQAVAAAQQAQNNSNSQSILSAVATGSQGIPSSSGTTNQVITSSGTGLRGPDVNTVFSTLAMIDAGRRSGGTGTSTLQNNESSTSRSDAAIGIPQDSGVDRTQVVSETNPVTAIIMSGPSVPATAPAATGSVVNRSVADNDAAVGGVNLAVMARQPVGYELYFAALSDRPFYAPREIYSGQRTIDNARVLRGLQRGSDNLHQQMVDQQYNRGN